MRDYIFPLVLSVLLMVLGVSLALQPVVDPGYLHPVALMLCGIGAAMSGAAFGVWALMAALMDKRDGEWSRAAADMSARNVAHALAHVNTW